MRAPKNEVEKKILGHFTMPQDELFELTLTKIVKDTEMVRYELEIKDFGDYTLVPLATMEEAAEAFMQRVNAQIAWLANAK